MLEQTYKEFSLHSTKGIDPFNGNLIYRIHAAKTHENTLSFNILVFFTEDYIEFNLKGIDPEFAIKREADEEVKRRIDNNDFENRQTYQKTFKVTN